MPDRFILSFLCLLIFFFAAMPVAAQTAEPGAASAAQDDQAQKPEPPKVFLKVEVRDDLLSVDLSNVDFGAAIKAVADKAGFLIEGTGEVFSRKLNTKFTDLEVERGVLRLLTLVKESNYMLHYDTKGLISKLEIFGISSVKTPTAPAKQPSRQTTPIRQTTAAPAKRQVQQPAAATPSRPQVQQPAAAAQVITQPRRPVSGPPASQTPLNEPIRRRRPVAAQPITRQPEAQSSEAVKPQPAAEETNEEETPVEEIPVEETQPSFIPAPVR